MRVFLVLLGISLSMAAPQGYNYDIDIRSSASNGIPGISSPLQTLQQQYYAPQIQNQQQQLPQQFTYQDQLAGQISTTGQSFSQDQSGSLQLGQNQFLQNDQQILQFEQQQQQQQLLNVQQPLLNVQQSQPQQLLNVQQSQPQQLLNLQQQQQEQALNPSTNVIVESPQQQLNELVEQPQATASFDTQPQFIITPKHEAQPQQLASSENSATKEKIVFEKEFYYLSAPQEDYETPKELEDQLNTIKKNLRVVFIKAPENNGLEKAALQLAQQSVNPQTAIYVLTKQHDTSELANKLQALKTSNPQRPEVAFIKYRTPEEADHAQRVIQAQFEALNGPNHINRPTIAVSHDFTGSNSSSVDPRKSNAVINNSTSGKVEKVGFPKPVSKYLPASAKH